MSKILIVDDEPMMLKLTNHILAGKYEVVTANNAEEALQLYEKEHPDLILTDLLMPGMTGFEMHETLQKRYTDVIPVIYMTADDTGESETKGFDLGAADYIHKPFRPDVLLRRVEHTLKDYEHMKDLREEAVTDPLTGLLNKGGVAKVMTRVCLEQSGVFMIIDLDSFKLVNDLYGHDDGDEILKCFAAVVRANVRSEDIVGRIGGDEFIAFCYGVNEEPFIRHFSESVNEQFLAGARRILGADMSIPFGASIGAVYVPGENGSRDYEEVFKNADDTLYNVKQNGKHGYDIFFKDENATVDLKQTDPKEDLERFSQILEERNIKDSALWLNQEAFTGVYRFLLRYLRRYEGTAVKAIFTLAFKVLWFCHLARRM